MGFVNNNSLIQALFLFYFFGLNYCLKLSFVCRGDTAFCSAECREKKMEQDFTKEKGITTAHGGGCGGRHKERSDFGSGF